MIDLTLALIAPLGFEPRISRSRAERVSNYATGHQRYVMKLNTLFESASEQFSDTVFELLKDHRIEAHCPTTAEITVPHYSDYWKAATIIQCYDDGSVTLKWWKDGASFHKDQIKLSLYDPDSFNKIIEFLKSRRGKLRYF